VEFINVLGEKEKKVENSLALKLARSTTAPVIRAGVIMANVAWYIQYTVAGIVAAYLQ
jgi:hypothetical protein